MKKRTREKWMSGGKFSSFYNVYLRAAGKSVAGPGAYGVVILGEDKKKDIFERSCFVDGKTFPAREYAAARVALELLNGREDKRITLNFGEIGIVNQLCGRWSVNDALRGVVSDFKEVADSFSNVRYEFVGSDNEWIIRARELASSKLLECCEIRL